MCVGLGGLESWEFSTAFLDRSQRKFTMREKYWRVVVGWLLSTEAVGVIRSR